MFQVGFKTVGYKPTSYAKFTCNDILQNSDILYKFLYDTGSTYLAWCDTLDSFSNWANGKVDIKHPVDYMPVSGYTGQTVTVPLFILSNFQIYTDSSAPIKFKDIPVIVLDNPDPDVTWIIGASVFATAGVVFYSNTHRLYIAYNNNNIVRFKYSRIFRKISILTEFTNISAIEQFLMQQYSCSEATANSILDNVPQEVEEIIEHSQEVDITPEFVACALATTFYPDKSIEELRVMILEELKYLPLAARAMYSANDYLAYFEYKCGYYGNEVERI